MLSPHSEKFERARAYRQRAETALRAADAAKHKPAREMFVSAALHYRELAALMERWVEPEWACIARSRTSTTNSEMGRL